MYHHINEYFQYPFSVLLHKSIKFKKPWVLELFSMAFSPKYSAFISQTLSYCGQTEDCNDGHTMITQPVLVSDHFSK